MAKVKLIALRTLPSDQGEILPGHAFSVELREAATYVQNKSAVYASEFRESLIQESKVRLDGVSKNSRASRAAGKSKGRKKAPENTGD